MDQLWDGDLGWNRRSPPAQFQLGNLLLQGEAPWGYRKLLLPRHCNKTQNKAILLKLKCKWKICLTAHPQLQLDPCLGQVGIPVTGIPEIPGTPDLGMVLILPCPSLQGRGGGRDHPWGQEQGMEGAPASRESTEGWPGSPCWGNVCSTQLPPPDAPPVIGEQEGVFIQRGRRAPKGAGEG